MRLIKEPLFTSELSRSSFRISPGSTFIYGQGEEDRSLHSESWLDECRKLGVRIIRISAQYREFIHVLEGTSEDELFLYDQEELSAFFGKFSGRVYLDITGLQHRTWAPLVRSAIALRMQLLAVYLEPAEYHRSDAQTPGKIYDLSDEIEGIEPLPGFARLGRSTSEEGYFVPMVGFEGPRLQQVMSSIETVRGNTFPVIGVPGFRPEYSFHAYRANRENLLLEYLHRKVHYAKANCPFDAFQTLAYLHSLSLNAPMKIAPIGTKPHALGAILFAISRGSSVEIVYDHPVRSPHRTRGEGRICLYDIESFVGSDLFGSTPSLASDTGVS